MKHYTDLFYDQKNTLRTALSELLKGNKIEPISVSAVPLADRLEVLKEVMAELENRTALAAPRLGSIRAKEIADKLANYPAKVKSAVAGK